MNARSLQLVLVLLVQILGPFGQSFFIKLAEFSINSLKMGGFLTGGFSYLEVRIEMPDL